MKAKALRRLSLGSAVFFASILSENLVYMALSCYVENGKFLY